MFLAMSLIVHQTEDRGGKMRSLAGEGKKGERDFIDREEAREVVDDDDDHGQDGPKRVRICTHLQCVCSTPRIVGPTLHCHHVCVCIRALRSLRPLSKAFCQRRGGLLLTGSERANTKGTFCLMGPHLLLLAMNSIKATLSSVRIFSLSCFLSFSERGGKSSF